MTMAHSIPSSLFDVRQSIDHTTITDHSCGPDAGRDVVLTVTSASTATSEQERTISNYLFDHASDCESLEMPMSPATALVRADTGSSSRVVCEGDTFLYLDDCRNVFDASGGTIIARGNERYDFQFCAHSSRSCSKGY
jgi:hypothetical protein